MSHEAINPRTCESTLTRFVWAGDQLLWELRVPGGNALSGSALDATNVAGAMYGRVSYFHAGGIDKPLLITKEGVESVVPRETWRGQFHAGTSPVTGASRNCPIGVHTGCLLVDWPGMRTNAQHGWAGEQPDIDVWYGGLVDGMRDASGQMYMRNRYYDPATGQFTQTDPIGIAGGMNVYGFAAGDPVTYSDPYGLKVECLNQAGCDAYNELVARVNAGLRSDDRRVRAGARRLAAVMNAAMNDQERTYYVVGYDFDERAEARTHGGEETDRPGGGYLIEVDTRPTSDEGYVQMPTWMLVAHELGGARSRSLGNGHNRGAIRAENGARMLVGCSKRWNHKWDNNFAYPPCWP
jgi:RHS repeat-associated protein